MLNLKCSACVNRYNAKSFGFAWYVHCWTVAIITPAPCIMSFISSLKTDFVFSGASNVQCVIGSFVDRSVWMRWITTLAAAAAAAAAVKHLRGFHSIHRKQFCVNQRLIVVQLQCFSFIWILLTAIHFISIALIHSISRECIQWICCCVYADD